MAFFATLCTALSVFVTILLLALPSCAPVTFKHSAGANPLKFVFPEDRQTSLREDQFSFLTYFFMGTPVQSSQRPVRRVWSFQKTDFNGLPNVDGSIVWSLLLAVAGGGGGGEMRLTASNITSKCEDAPSSLPWHTCTQYAQRVWSPARVFMIAKQS